MSSFPPQVRHELAGWVLFWADLEPIDCPAETLAALRRDVVARVRASFDLERLSEHATVAGVRRLFRLAGCDPTRHRPASEAMLRRLLKGEELPAIHPLVDLNNCLSAELAVPVCMMDRERLAPPFVWRAGQRGESMMSLKGPFNVDAKPLLLDQEGPVDVPITGSERVKITSATRRAWLVAYLPAGVLDPPARRSHALNPACRSARRPPSRSRYDTARRLIGNAERDQRSAQALWARLVT